MFYLYQWNDVTKERIDILATAVGIPFDLAKTLNDFKAKRLINPGWVLKISVTENELDFLFPTLQNATNIKKCIECKVNINEAISFIEKMYWSILDKEFFSA